MRNPERIKRVLSALETLWNQHPDMRFFQIIDLVKGEDDLFYLEDDKALDLIYKTMGQWARGEFAP